jgi:biopolymer transport protein ExbD
MRFSRRKKLLSAHESTAMTDIIFLLMIFFLLTSSFIVQTGIKVQVPQVSRIDRQTKGDIEVTITADEDLYLDGVKVPWASFRGALAERLQTATSKIVIIKGDENVRLGRTVQVMDIARQLGAEQLAIAARPLLERERH